MKRVAITGANGFVGKNLVMRLSERPAEYEIVSIDHRHSEAELARALTGCDVVIHLAGVSRPTQESEYETGNVGFTTTLIGALEAIGSRASLFYASSIHAERDTPYGRSKRVAEVAVAEYGARAEVPVRSERLPNVFGKWGRPNYNSVVATFCANLANDLPLTIDRADAELRLLYIDNLVDWFVSAIKAPEQMATMDSPGPIYLCSVGALAEILRSFKEGRSNLFVDRVGTGLLRALHATYLSFLPPNAFSYDLDPHSDARGRFVEVLKTQDSGQVSYFTAKPGVTRGGHYHHTKTEKFLVVGGRAHFGFRNILTNERYEMYTDAEYPQVVETIPGWAHDITNVGEELLVVLLWASEIFDRGRPDTVTSRVLK